MREAEVQAQIALVDACVALAGTFDALLSALLSTTTTPLQMMMQLTAELLPQLRAYQGAFAAWTEVNTPQHTFLVRLSSLLLEDLLRARQRLCGLLAGDAVGEEELEEEEELDRRLVRINDVNREVRNRLSRLPVPCYDTAAASSATTEVAVTASGA
jgi:hypothetical protein